MIWTKKKPTIPGFYWLQMLDTPFSQQPPRVVKVVENEGEMWAFGPPDYEEGSDDYPLCEMSDNFDWSSEPIALPVVQGSCGCGESARCHACPPKKKESLGFMYMAERGCGRISAAAWDDPEWSDEMKHAELAIWKDRGDTVKRVERFEGDPQPEWICHSENCQGDCVEPE